MKTYLTLAVIAGLFMTAPITSAVASAPAMQNPALLVDIGLGNNARSINALLRRSPQIQAEMVELANASHLAGKKTLIIAVGASTKGLGAAGLDVGQETARTEALLSAAKEQGIPVIGVHSGGESRRGELSDQFNERVLRASSVFIVWEEGNRDGFFTRLAEANGVDLRIVPTRLGVGAELDKLFPR